MYRLLETDAKEEGREGKSARAYYDYVNMYQREEEVRKERKTTRKGEEEEEETRK